MTLITKTCQICHAVSGGDTNVLCWRCHLPLVGVTGCPDRFLSDDGRCHTRGWHETISRRCICPCGKMKVPLGPIATWFVRALATVIIGPWPVIAALTAGEYFGLFDVDARRYAGLVFISAIGFYIMIVSAMIFDDKPDNDRPCPARIEEMLDQHARLMGREP